MGSLLAVFIGGIVGTALRLEVDDLIPHSDNQFPLSTLLINAIGSFALAVLVARIWPRVPGWVRAGLGPGFMGGFTTFSAVMVSMVTLAASGLIVTALVYLLLTLVFGIGAAALGFWMARPKTSVPTLEVDE